MERRKEEEDWRVESIMVSGNANSANIWHLNQNLSESLHADIQIVTQPAFQPGIL